MGYWKTLSQCVNLGEIPSALQGMSFDNIDTYDIIPDMAWNSTIAGAVRANGNDIPWWKWILFPWYALYKWWLENKLEEERRNSRLCKININEDLDFLNCSFLI